MSVSFEFDVSEPQKKETNKTLDVGYWTYKVTARTNLSQYRNMALVTMRRYSDFDWLRQQLVLTYPGIIVPPIPEKELSGTLQKITSTSDSASPLLQYRQRNLRRFLMRVGAHSVLGPSRLLQEFLEMNDADWAERMKNGKKKESGSSAMTRRISMKISGMGTHAAITEPLADPAMTTSLLNYVKQLEGVLTVLKDKLVIYAHRRKEATAVARDVGRSLVQLGEFSEMLNDASLSRIMQEIGTSSVNISNVGVNQSELELTQLAESVHYYIGISGSMREVIHCLQAEKSELAFIATQLADAVVGKEKAEATNNSASIAKYEAQLPALTAQRDAKRKDIQNLEATLMAEINRIHQEKLYDFQQLLRCFGDIQVEYADKMTKSWQSLEPLIAQTHAEVTTSPPPPVSAAAAPPAPPASTVPAADPAEEADVGAEEAEPVVEEDTVKEACNDVDDVAFE
eukprot:PhM_4_TR5809/c0_g1_i1/m.30660/K17917/SNX1_2; sorting nexin-1/2